MATRSPVSQSLHDRVLLQREKAWRADAGLLHVYVNVGQQESVPYTVDSQELYPDLIIEHRQHGWFIEEVETEDTIDAHQLAQWRRLARSDIALNLVVPEQSRSKAQKLIGNLPNVHRRTYRATDSAITFS